MRPIDEFLSIINSERLIYLTGYGTDNDELWGRERSYLLFLNDRNSQIPSPVSLPKRLFTGQAKEPVKLLLNKNGSYKELGE